MNKWLKKAMNLVSSVEQKAKAEQTPQIEAAQTEFARKPWSGGGKKFERKLKLFRHRQTAGHGGRRHNDVAVGSRHGDYIITRSGYKHIGSTSQIAKAATA